MYSKSYLICKIAQTPYWHEQWLELARGMIPNHDWMSASKPKRVEQSTKLMITGAVFIAGISGFLYMLAVFWGNDSALKDGTNGCASVPPLNVRWLNDRAFA